MFETVADDLLYNCNKNLSRDLLEVTANTI